MHMFLFSGNEGLVFLAYRIKNSANYTGASKSYLTHPHPSRGKININNFHVFDIYSGCIGPHGTPLLRLTSLNVMTSLNVTVLSSRYGRRLQSKWLHCQKPTVRNERYARKRLYLRCEGQTEKFLPRQALWCQTVTLGTDFSIYPSNQ